MLKLRGPDLSNTDSNSDDGQRGANVSNDDCGGGGEDDNDDWALWDKRTTISVKIPSCASFGCKPP